VLKIAGYAVEGKEGSRLIEELALLFRILTTKSLTIFPETKKVLEELSTKVRMAIVSNSQRLFTVPELVRFDIAKYFEHIVISSDLRARKPSPKIFQRALDALKVSPANAIYVGDNLFDDVWGAKNLGMKTVWINHGASPNVSVQKGLPAPDVEVADIGDVVKYVCAECQ
jgi:putative hydrolase of the HAD superfamily